jgi:hypothetical protein
MQEEATQETSNQVEPREAPEINLENLRAGKFTTKDIPRPEAARLWREEYASLEEGAKEVADTQGWKPEHFLKGQKDRDGNPKKFKDWKEFAQETREKLPVLNERLKHSTKEKLEADEKIARLETQIANMSKLQRLQAERELKKDKSSIDQEMQEAFDNGDREKFVAAEKRKAQVESEEKILKEFEPQQAPRPIIKAPEVLLFEANNPWFGQDKVMTAYARQRSGELMSEFPNATLSQNLQMVEDEMKVEFADKFSKSTNSPAPAVESARNSGRLTMGSNSEISFDELPADERGRAEEMIRLKMTTKADFVKGYNDHQKSKRQR